MNNSQTTKKEHYIPQFYLYQFIDGNNELSVFNFKTGKLFKTVPSKLGYKKYLYETEWVDADPKCGKFILENEIEKIFSNYEGEFSTLLKTIKRVCTLTQNPNALILNQKEKKLLFRFVINMLIRSPYNMEILQLNQISKDIEESDLMQSLRITLNEMGIGGADSLALAAQKKAMLTEEFPDSFPEQYVNSLKKIPFHFFYAEEGEFVTSDLPALLGDDLTILEEDKTSIYFPLLPKVAVIFGYYDKFKNRNNRMTVIKKKYVDKFNKKFVSKCKEYSYSVIGKDMKLIKQYL